MTSSVPDEKRDCSSCPSFLTPTDSASFFGKSVSAPMCARFGKVLGRPGATQSDNRHTRETIASSCHAYGTARPTRADSKLDLVVTLPDMDLRTQLSPTDSRRTVVRSCGQCKNFLPDDKVAEKYGWTAGMCGAKGRLIMAHRRATEAAGCDFRQVGANRVDLDLPLLTAYQRPAVRVIDGDGELVRGDDSHIEPLDYRSDRELTEEDVENGIQAWRRLEDPEGTGNFVMLPIFNPKAFTEQELELIPQTGDDEHPESYFDHNGAVYRIGVLWMELDETPAVWGMPGIGKTEIYRHLAWLMQVPFHRFSIKESTELYELEGSKEYDADKGTWFREGRFTRAWGTVGVSVVDEPNMGRPEVWAFLRPCMDNSKQLVLDSYDGSTRPRNGFAFMGLAMNPAWSPLNVGTSPIGAADASRLMHVKFDLPDEPVERNIIQNRVKIDGWKLDRIRMDLIISVSTNIRALCASGDLQMSWGIRENIKVARALRWFGPVTAYRMAAGDYLEPSQEQSVLDLVRASMPSALPGVQLLDQEA